MGEGESVRSRPNPRIRDEVMNSLGLPPELFRVVVMPLWQNYYRVNVLVGADVTAVRIAHSYFLATDDDGHIRAATPAITRQYP